MQKNGKTKSERFRGGLKSFRASRFRGRLNYSLPIYPFSTPKQTVAQMLEMLELKTGSQSSGTDRFYFFDSILNFRQNLNFKKFVKFNLEPMDRLLPLTIQIFIFLSEVYRNVFEWFGKSLKVIMQQIS